MNRIKSLPAWSTHCLGVCLLTLSCMGSVLAAPVSVSAQPLGELAIFPELRAPATVLSLNHSSISAEVSARIVEIPVQTGQLVDKGTVLVRLESRDYQLALERAQAGAALLAARRELADYELQRARSLSAKNVVSEQVLKQREAEVKSLQAEQDNQRILIRQAQRSLDKTILRAPFKAIINNKIAQLGEFSAAGTPLLQIVDTESLEVSARVQATLAGSLMTASQLELDTAGQRYPLELRTLIPLVENRAQTREARLGFVDQRALPGEAGELVWQNLQTHIPAELLVRRDGKLGIFIVTGNQTQFFSLDAAQEGRPAQTSLNPDTLLVTQGRFQIQDGDEVLLQQ